MLSGGAWTSGPGKGVGASARARVARQTAASNIIFANSRMTSPRAVVNLSPRQAAPQSARRAALTNPPRPAYSSWKRGSGGHGVVTGVLEAGGRIEGQSLSDADWAEAEAPDAVFVGCLIEDVRFADTVLEGARFERCRLIRCRFAHADLREAVFEDCQFFDPAAQQGAAFAFSRLEGARFARCDLTHARFEGSELYDVGFEACNLTGASFARSSFARTFGRKVERIAAVFLDCHLGLADLSETRLAGARLARSRLREADISNADLEGADLTGADLFGAIVDGAKLAGADLRGAEVSGLDLRRLGSYRDLKITADQQFRLLDAMGIDVQPE